VGPLASPPLTVPGLPDDALSAWLTACGSLDGLAGDFAREAAGAAWQDDVLEVTLPAHAAAAQAFLRRSDVAAAIGNAIEALAGRRVVHRIVLAAAATAAPPVAGGEVVRRIAPAQSQAALVREVSEHPLVTRARAVFDAAIRKVDPPRSRPAAVAAPADGAVAVSDVATDDELDHDRDHAEEP
jgi:hypothetical protein